MKTFIFISRVLLGLMFAVFGLNGFLNFIPTPPATGLAGQYLGALFVSHYLAVVFALELSAGVLLLTNRFVPLALAVLAPIIVNIALFHAFMAPQGFAPALLAIALWSVLFYRERAAFAGLLAARTDSRHAFREETHAPRRVATHAPQQLAPQSTASH